LTIGLNIKSSILRKTGILGRLEGRGPKSNTFLTEFLLTVDHQSALLYLCTLKVMGPAIRIEPEGEILIHRECDVI
jgi:hypothetical protein